ncbi:MAG: hypothetical protein GF375_06070 [Candidatus Omnitrophica bacterium]|nr:hypothetical protein [Candidatus Omnitrophota bacterium]MBD3269542.1 hypothetical protein [Candidatus Omnitrophota bacterium]
MKKYITFVFFIIVVVSASFFFIQRHIKKEKVLERIINNLKADSRIAEVLVVVVEYDEPTGERLTTIKFLEYNSEGEPLEPKYFTFSGNTIQFQSLVVRFDEDYAGMGDELRGKSVYLFWKVFMLDGKDTEEFTITEIGSIPRGYKVKDLKSDFERKLWENFWEYALNKRKADTLGIKSAQIEAPGSVFIPGILYTLKIEHDGGIFIESSPLPDILKGENIYIPG